MYGRHQPIWSQSGVAGLLGSWSMAAKPIGWVQTNGVSLADSDIRHLYSGLPTGLSTPPRTRVSKQTQSSNSMTQSSSELADLAQLAEATRGYDSAVVPPRDLLGETEMRRRCSGISDTTTAVSTGTGQRHEVCFPANSRNFWAECQEG